MANNKVLLGNEVLIDLTDSTVNPNVLLAGYKAYDASGNAITGEFRPSYHITLTQAQYDQLSQTEKMADENFFYITDAVVVGADIDDTTTSTTKVWSSSKTNTELGLKADKTQITNPNLLDNPWFTINQRGQNSYSGSIQYTVDRWKILSSAGTLTVNSDGSITVTTTGQCWLVQYLPLDVLERLKGRTITLSIDAEKSGGSSNVYSGYNTQSSGWQRISDDVALPTTRGIVSRTATIPTSLVGTPTNYEAFGIYIGANISITIYSTKIEVGSISTLALDTAPNYATELLKCQRYFVRINGGSNNNGILTSGGFTTSATQMRGQIPLPVQMRTQPAITTGGNIRVGKPTATIATANQISSYSVASLSPTLVNIIVNVTATMDTNIIANLFASSDLTAHIDLIADL